jgi:FtsP/CotA-like multicopper oxidase with cupredoxin domain
MAEVETNHKMFSSPWVIVFVLLVLFELFTPALLLDFGGDAPAEPQIIGHTAAHDEPDLLCDLAPGNAVRKYELVAQPAEWEIEQGHPIPIWTFNGSVPGPTICARVGDRIEVTLTNRLSTIASFHAHGVAFDKASDGTFLSKSYVPPGGSRTYYLEAKPDSVGTWAYHDSVAELDEKPFVPGLMIPESGEGIERGMYGAIIILDGSEEPVDHEVLLFLGDVGPEVTRRGSVQVINGRAAPLTPHIFLEQGERARFRIINAGPNDAHDFAVSGHLLENVHNEQVTDGTVSVEEFSSVTLGSMTFGDWIMTAGAPNDYPYLCNVGGHYEAGMHGILTVLPKEQS